MMALRNFPILVLFSVIGLLTVGILSNGSERALAGMVLFAATAGLSYCAMMTFSSAQRPVVAIADRMALSPSTSIVSTWLVGLSAVAIALVHVTEFDGLMLGPALRAKTNIEVALIRMNLTETLPPAMQYLKSIAINTLFPIGILIAVIKRMRLLAVIVATAGIFYAICMMQKSGPVIMALPILAYFGCTQRWMRALVGSVFVIGAVFAMDYIAEPALRPEIVRTAFRSASSVLPNTASKGLSKPEVAQPLPPADTTDRSPSLAAGLLRRIAVTPGDVVAKWFNAVPSEIPYALGCGYRLLTAVLGCEFQNFSISLYPKFFPEYEKIGLRGTVNSASMMTAYANFGMPGVAISGVLHGLLAWGLFALFYRTPELSPAFNSPYVLLLSSGDLFTMLLSGGWALALVLYVTLCRTQRQR